MITALQSLARSCSWVPARGRCAAVAD